MQLDTVTTARIGKNRDGARDLVRLKNDHTRLVEPAKNLEPPGLAGSFGQIDVLVQIDQITVEQLSAVRRDVDDLKSVDCLVETLDRCN